MMTSKIYFDVTDIVEYAQGNQRVSGIQRVQARVISSLAARDDSERIRCIFYDKARRQMLEFPAACAFTGSEFDSKLLLFRLGVIKEQFFPHRADVKNHLRQYNKRKVRRAVKKIAIYGSSIFNPKYLKKFGLETYHPPKGEKAAPTKPITGLNSSDKLVFLGSNWSFPEVLQFGIKQQKRGGEVIQMMYDLIPYKTPQYCIESLVKHFNSFLKATPTYASRFMAISEWTKNDMLDFLSSIGATRDVTTIPLAHEFDGYKRNEAGTPPSNSELLALTQQPFVLCVGTIEVRKNGIALLQAWKELAHQLGDKLPQLVFAGKYGWMIDDFLSLIKESEVLKSKVTIIASPSDQDLAHLYQQSLFTIYPSLYEGWGLPVGEAAWFGRHTITSTLTSMPEVCGELVDYVDPTSIEDICLKVQHAVEHPEYVEARVRAMHASKLRTWDDVAEDIRRCVDGDTGETSKLQ
jgi:glycosyltransferase involved in cell wall biosynthesis